jgi:glucokinase
MPSFGGIDLGGTKIQAVIVDDDNNAVGSARRATPTTGGPPDVARELVTALRDAAKAAEIDTRALAGIGVGSPGSVQEGNVTGAGNLPGWEGTYPLAAVLERDLGCRVSLGNDVRVATLAEFKLGAGRLYESLLCVSWGTGVGGGLILEGRPWIGRGSAGEIGHVVVEIDGALCTCGRRGCMEAYAGRAAMEIHARHLHDDKGRKTDLFKLMREHNRARLTSGVWARALEQKDKLATHMIERAVRALGAGIASVQNVLDVEGVIISGGLGVRLGHPYAKRISDAMMPHLFVDSHPPHVHVAALGDLSGGIGAALLAREAAPAETGRPADPGLATGPAVTR